MKRRTIIILSVIGGIILLAVVYYVFIYLPTKQKEERRNGTGNGDNNGTNGDQPPCTPYSYDQQQSDLTRCTQKCNQKYSDIPNLQKCYNDCDKNKKPIVTC